MQGVAEAVGVSCRALRSSRGKVAGCHLRPQQVASATDVTVGGQEELDRQVVEIVCFGKSCLRRSY